MAMSEQEKRDSKQFSPEINEVLDQLKNLINLGTVAGQQNKLGIVPESAAPSLEKIIDLGRRTGLFLSEKDDQIESEPELFLARLTIDENSWWLKLEEIGPEITAVSITYLLPDLNARA